MGSIDTTNAQELHEQYQPIGELLTVASDITQKNSALEQLIGNGPVTAAADPTIADVVAALTDAANGPSTEVANGKVPMPQNVGVMPPYDEPSAGQNYNHLVEMSSIVSLYTAIWNANARTKRGNEVVTGLGLCFLVSPCDSQGTTDRTFKHSACVFPKKLE
jgi:hypothetical protein